MPQGLTGDDCLMAYARCRKAAQGSYDLVGLWPECSERITMTVVTQNLERFEVAVVNRSRDSTHLISGNGLLFSCSEHSV